MARKRKQSVNGFTLVELTVALMVSAIILSAVATLAHATCLAKEATDDMGRGQAQFRQVSVKLRDLLKQGNIVVSQDAEWGFVVWQDKDADGNRDVGECVVVYSYSYYDSEAADYQTMLAIRRLDTNEAVMKSHHGWYYGFLVWKDYNNNGSYNAGESLCLEYSIINSDQYDDQTEIYRQCKNPTFEYDEWEDGYPRTVIVRFGIEENGQTWSYSINAHLLGAS